MRRLAGGLRFRHRSARYRRTDRSKAEKCRQLRRERLLRETGYSAADALHGLAELDAAGEPVESAPSVGDQTVLVSAALDIVEARTIPARCPLRPRHVLPRQTRWTGAEPHIWMRSLIILLRHGYRTNELLAALPQARGTEIGEAVLLALEHAPQHALPLIRKGLLADIPINRSEVAAILA